MPIELLPSLLLMIIGVGFSPGPGNAFSLTYALRYGRRAALRMWLGLLVGFTIGALVMAFATHLLGEAMGQYVRYVKYVGSAYMIYLAWQVYHFSGKARVGRKSNAFLSGMIVQLTNAKLLLLDILVFSTYVLPYEPNNFAAMLPIAGLLEIAGPGGNLAWIFVGSAFHHQYARYRRRIDLVLALCLLGCAVFIVLS